MTRRPDRLVSGRMWRHGIRTGAYTFDTDTIVTPHTHQLFAYRDPAPANPTGDLYGRVVALDTKAGTFTVEARTADLYEEAADGYLPWALPIVAVTTFRSDSLTRLTSCRLIAVGLTGQDYQMGLPLDWRCGVVAGPIPPAAMTAADLAAIRSDWTMRRAEVMRTIRQSAMAANLT